MARGRKFLGEEAGATMVEYAFILVLLGVGLIAVVTSLGTSVRDIFTTTAGKF